MQGVLGCLMQLHWQSGDSCLQLPIAWQTDCLWMQNWVGVQVDRMGPFPKAGSKGICQGGGDQHEAPAAHPGSCKVKLCMTRLMLLHITLHGSGYKTVALFCCYQGTDSSSKHTLS